MGIEGIWSQGNPPTRMPKKVGYTSYPRIQGIRGGYKMNFSKALLAGACIAQLAGCASIDIPMAIQDVTKDVQLAVVEAGARLKVNTLPDSGCRKGHQVDGCIHIGYNEVGAVVFRLVTGGEWHLTEFQICKGDEKAAQDCNLTVWERMEWSATNEDFTSIAYPDENGIIDLTSLGSDLDEFVILDQNNFKQDWYYTVTACDATNTNCPDTDPPWENTGRR
jgi:hypothetical protein